VTQSSVRVRVPASSANLGPGFDSFAAALALFLELEVSAAEDFVLESDLPLPRDRTNLVVRAFELLRPASGLRFRVNSQIPLSGGLGSSAAAIVAGLIAAVELGGDREADLLALATGLEGHPDNVAAALHGGVVIYADGEVHRLTAPPELDLLVVVAEDGVSTAQARAALPTQVPRADAVFNTAHGALLMLGLQTGDLELVARGLHDRLHEPYRAPLYPRSAEVARSAATLGALGATISGSGPSVLVWCSHAETERVREALEIQVRGWATVLATAFTDAAASVLGAAGPGD
jgi:homoserine kinase